ncbi:PDDEXK-like family protein [Prevotella sp.]|uniref:PDDEXK-like family protein n=2 Tax=Prevotella sp. TaxID=59823 RepID=UPI003AB565CD
MEEDKIRNLQVLLQRLDIVRDKITARNEGKEKFNIFTCLMDSSDEVNLHSRFISSLLDPQGNHGLGFAPIDILLKTLNSSFQYDQETIEVIPSFSNWSEYKEIDILLIDRRTKYAIIIENKINACDSNHGDEGQLERYYRRIIEEDKIPQENVEVYYLTIDGHEPSEESVSTSSRYKDLPDILRCITYGNEIMRWLQQCMQIACNKPFIRETIAQYINLIKEMINDTEIEDRLEILKIISKNDDTLASAKLLFDNYKHIQWQTIFDLFQEFYSELEKRGYKCLSKVENATIDNIVHGGPKLRKQNPQFSFKKSDGLQITIGCDYDDWFYFGLKSKENKLLDKKKINEFIKTNQEYEQYCYVDKEWIFNICFDVPDEISINIWNFEHNGTFRIIKPDTRKETINRYLDDMEDFLYNKMNIFQFAKTK